MKRYTQQINPLIFDAVDKLCDFIKPTFGPAQNKIIIERGRYQEVLDDGVATAKEFELEDEFENSVVRLVKEAAIKTNDRVGDGTTSSLIMLQALMKEIKEDKRTSREIIKELQQGLEEFKKEIKKRAKKIKTKKDLKQAACNLPNQE